MAERGTDPRRTFGPREIGIVYLVGAGPGDPELITLKAVRRLKSCDVVVYDHLASDRLLEHAPDRCERIYAGKRAGRHSMKQEEINDLLVRLAREGRTVVRLKGGDPFVFGRGGEEAMALAGAGIPYEIVWGVTSAIAAPGSAGIPVTHREVSRSFHVMTGHTLAGGEALPDDFEQFARLSGTLVFLMGVGKLSRIAAGLRLAGKPGDTPAAVVENGTLPGGRSVRGTLDDIAQKAEEAGIRAPAVIVVGAVAAFDLSSTVHRPLDGAVVSVVGTDSFTERLCGRLERDGAVTKRVCRMVIHSHEKDRPMAAAYRHLSDYSWIVFTSANAVRLFFAGFFGQGGDCRAMGRTKFAAVGRGTAGELSRHGFHADYVPDRYRVDSLARGLAGRLTSKDRVLIPRSADGSLDLTKGLTEQGILHDDIALYEVIGQKLPKEEIRQALEESHYLLFASASGVRAFFGALSPSAGDALEGVRIGCIGDITAAALEVEGREADVVAETFDIPGLVDSVERDWTGDL